MLIGSTVITSSYLRSVPVADPCAEQHRSSVRALLTRAAVAPRSSWVICLGASASYALYELSSQPLWRTKLVLATWLTLTGLHLLITASRYAALYSRSLST